MCQKIVRTLSLMAMLVAWTAICSAQKKSEEEKYLDSLKVQYEKATGAEERMALLSQIANDHYNIDSTFHYASQLLSMANEHKASKYQMAALRYLSWTSCSRCDYAQALRCDRAALAIADSMGDTPSKAYCYENMASSYAMIRDYAHADQYYHKALDIYLEYNDVANATEVYCNLGLNHLDNGMHDEAKQSFTRALTQSRKTGNKEGMANAMCGLGRVAMDQYEQSMMVEVSNDTLIEDACYWLSEAYKAAMESDEDIFIMHTTMSLSRAMLHKVEQGGMLMEEKKEMQDSCRQLLQRAYDRASMRGDDFTKIDLDFEWLNYLIVSHQNGRAEAFADSIYNVFCTDQERYESYLGDLYRGYERIYRSENRINEAFHAKDLSTYWANHNKKSSYAVMATQSIAQSQFDETMRQREAEVRRNEERLESAAQRRFIIMLASLVVLALVTVFTIFVVRSNMHRKKVNIQLDHQNAALKEQKDQIELQKSKLETANAEITDSINYASLIQKAALPSDEQMQAIWGDHLLFFRPLNIVSGDFYWTKVVGDLKILVVADCTGHGVPGAFVSMLGISVLNEIVQHISAADVSAGRMLDEMRSKVKESLRQRGEENDNRDGMDLALLIVNTKKKELHYAGAFRPLLMLRDGELTKMEADRMPIGSHLRDTESFRDNCIAYRAGDTFYAFSDGYTDQFGHDERKGGRAKFTAKRLNALLTEIGNQPFAQQKKRLEETIDAWRRTNTEGAYEQTDDNIIIGIKMQ